MEFKRTTLQDYNDFQIEVGSFQKGNNKNIYYINTSAWIKIDGEEITPLVKNYNTIRNKLRTIIKNTVSPLFNANNYILDLDIPMTALKVEQTNFLSFELTLKHEGNKTFKEVVVETKPIIHDIIDKFKIVMEQLGYKVQNRRNKNS